MKRVLAFTLSALFAVSIVGCRAEGEIDDDDRDTSYKKTTTVDRDNGERTVRTEKKVERD